MPILSKRAGDQRPNFYDTLNALPELFMVFCSTG